MKVRMWSRSCISRPRDCSGTCAGPGWLEFESSIMPVERLAFRDFLMRVTPNAATAAASATAMIRAGMARPYPRDH